MDSEFHGQSVPLYPNVHIIVIVHDERLVSKLVTYGPLTLAVALKRFTSILGTILKTHKLVVLTNHRK